MDADKLRAARDRGVVTSDISSRSQMVTTERKEGSAWARLLRIRRPK
jgi:hypothetical protein